MPLKHWTTGHEAARMSRQTKRRARPSGNNPAAGIQCCIARLHPVLCPVLCCNASASASTHSDTHALHARALVLDASWPLPLAAAGHVHVPQKLGPTLPYFRTRHGSPGYPDGGFALLCFALLRQHDGTTARDKAGPASQQAKLLLHTSWLCLRMWPPDS